MASLSLKHIYKIYQGGVKAVSDFNLDIDMPAGIYLITTDQHSTPAKAIVR